MNALRRAATGLAGFAVVALLLSGPGHRFGVWPYQVSLLLLLAAGVAGLAAFALALVGLCVPRFRGTGATVFAAVWLLGGACAAVPLEFLRQALSVPPINDISTDLANPAFADLQRKAYPDIQPLTLAEPPPAAYARALAAAEAMRWELTVKDASAGRIEAVASSAWFGFKDDVLVRITPVASGSRVDVRSKSRVGRSDIGANARRIRDYFERLK